MTNKQAYEVIENLIHRFVPIVSCEVTPSLELIKEDIEVVDILQKCLKVKTGESNKEKIIVSLESLSSDEIYKIKEWLKDDKRN